MVRLHLSSIQVGLLMLVFMLGIGIVGVSLALSNVPDASPLPTLFPTNTPASFEEWSRTVPRYLRDGYEVIEERVLVDGARKFMSASDAIEREQIFYVKAGYWRHTSTFPDYRSDPDHPIFIYTFQGKMGRPMLDLGAPPSKSDLPTPEQKPWEAVTIAMDAVSGSLLYFTDQYTEDVKPDMLQGDHADTLKFAATMDAIIGPVDLSLPAEATHETIPLPTQNTIPLPSAP